MVFPMGVGGIDANFLSIHTPLPMAPYPLIAPPQAPPVILTMNIIDTYRGWY